MTNIHSLNTKHPSKYLDWLNPLKAFALLAILLNHFVEEFGPGPWFTNPTQDWPDIATRISNIFPQSESFPLSLVQFFGWLGDSGPGVFILLSGLGLTWSFCHRARSQPSSYVDFYKRRLLRIFPFYIAAHFIILFCSLIFSSSHLTFAHSNTLLSIIGLRCTDNLFFFINPSWWFVWLILQLYFIYPWLQKYLIKWGVSKFLIITFAFTFLSRALGLVGIRYSENLFNWMTGIFFGTRLAEFTAGMAIGLIFYNASIAAQKKFSRKNIFYLSVLSYILGLVASFTWLGSVFSNLLVTLGMTGLFYSIWVYVMKNSPIASKVFIWIGLQSYGIYLIHQTPLIWTGSVFPNNTNMHVIAALFVILLSFPGAYIIKSALDFLLKNAKSIINNRFVEYKLQIFLFLVTSAFFVIDIKINSQQITRLYALILSSILALLIIIEIAGRDKRNQLISFLRGSIAACIIFKLFVFSPQSKIAILVGGFVGTLLFFSIKIFHSRTKAVLFSILAFTVILLLTEWILVNFCPIEIEQWGELPALQKHPTRIYSLKPNIEERLRYNNYSYVIKTNSLGLTSPEINIEKPSKDTCRILVLGDAFAMPEGLEYKNAFPALLEKKLTSLKSSNSFQVINAGVTGYGPIEQYPQLLELGDLFKPDIVLYQFFVNEFEDIHHSSVDMHRQIGLDKSNESLREKLVENSQWFNQLNLIIGSIREAITGVPANWKKSKALLDYYQIEHTDIYSESSLSKLRQYIELMQSYCQEIEAHFIIYFVPGATGVSAKEDIAYLPRTVNLNDESRYDLQKPLKVLTKLLDGLDIPLMDLTAPLINHVKQPVYFKRSWHWNEEGHQVAADVIANDILGRFCSHLY